MDQGFFSGANFIVNILLARWISPENYGAYSVSFAVLLFIIGSYIALVLEPASVLGPVRHGAVLSSYLLSLFQIHFLLSLAIGILLLATGLFLKVMRIGSDVLALAIMSNGIMLPFTLLIWLVRRFFYILQWPEIAFGASAVFCLIFIGGVVLAYQLGILTVPLTFILSGLASLAGAIFACYIGRRFFNNATRNYMNWQDVFQEQWKYGKWRTTGSILSVAFGQMQTFFVAGMIGLDAAGALRAIQNFVQPMTQIQTAIESIGLPSVSREFGEGNFIGIKKKAFLISAFLLSLSIIYTVFLLLYSDYLVALLYLGNYSGYANLIPVFSLMPVFVSVATGFTLSLLAIQKPQYYLIVYSINAPIALIVTIVLIKYFGVVGAVISIMFPSIINLLVSWFLYQRWFPKER